VGSSSLTVLDDRHEEEEKHEMNPRRVTPEGVTELPDGGIFVFGSNRMGIHGRGAAMTARVWFGAERGVSEGLTGRSYAFPTVDRPSGWNGCRRATAAELEASRDRFFEAARSMPEMTFWLTRVGCGLAGFTDAEMAPLFRDAPENVIKPPGWQ
jgi:hypothetical protein